MRAVVQRVKEAAVHVDGQQVSRVGRGLLVFLGVGQEDLTADVQLMVDKVANLRIFADADDKMNRSVLDIQGHVLVVSQFTLWGDCRKGRRPSFTGAAPPNAARLLYEAFVGGLSGLGLMVQTGRFQETMEVHLVNDGPVTLLLDTRKLF
jgi:D-tyrosyl-tRNA(Tyr) deacylase